MSNHQRSNVGRHGLYHKEPFIKLAALFVAEHALLHYPKHSLHCNKLDHVSKKAFKVHGSMGSRLPWSGDKSLPFQRAAIGLDIHLATTKKFETMGVPQICDMIGCMATGLPSRHTKYDALDEPPPHKRCKVNKEEEADKDTTKDNKFSTVEGSELAPVV